MSILSDVIKVQVFVVQRKLNALETVVFTGCRAERDAAVGAGIIQTRLLQAEFAGLENLIQMLRSY